MKTISSPVNAVPLNDEPCSPVTWPPFWFNYFRGSFTSYLMFKSEEGYVSSNIPVALGKAVWSMDGESKLQLNPVAYWLLIKNSVIPPAVFIESDDFPEWNSFVLNISST